MKNILFIGRLNDIVKDVNAYLSECFHVQLCSENAGVVEGMLKIVKPDLVLISLVGAYDIDSSIFYLLSKEYGDTPVITIGTKDECSYFTRFYEETQFENLIRPVENQDIYQAICRRLGIEAAAGGEKISSVETAGPDGEAGPAGRINPAGELRPAKKHILVVDDNGTTLRTVKAMLEDRFEVSVAISGAQAMTSMGKKRPDLILLDYEMPVCDGRMTLEMIRAEEELCDIPVIFLTGVNSRDHIEAVLELRPAGYYLKPPVKEVLIEKIEGVLGKLS
ncbi:MAG: response regulator [Butyrivibrio sp.]|nr:response regulator [Acetatifactor muris]MCM1561152.1 response regulator [Butyrivibrio sp.]